MYNGLLLCPNHDCLFDNGIISFNDDGTIMISTEMDNINQVYTNINPNMKLSLDDDMRNNMKYHRDNVLKNRKILHFNNLLKLVPFCRNLCFMSELY